MAQQYLQVDEENDQALINFLNPMDKGSDCLIIHPGSHSIKFGLSSQMQPFIAPNVIAYPAKGGKKIFVLETNIQTEEQRQFMFDTQIEKVLPEVEHALRKKRFLLIDAKSAKNIRNKQVSFKVFDESNTTNEYQEHDDPFNIDEDLDPISSDMYSSMDRFSFINNTDQINSVQQSVPYYVGKEALALNKNEEYILRYPIKYGDLNITQSYNIQDCIQDLQNILEQVLWKYMRLPKKNYENFNCILVIPDLFIKHHLRYIVQMLLGKMRFKSIFMHNESVLATYAMALPSACIVDIGSSKVSVCCVDEGLLVPKSIQRKHYGGDDLNEVLYRFINRNKALHHFPRNILNLDYHYHKLLIEQLKEQFAVSEMDQTEIVKTCNLWIKDKQNKKLRKCTQVTFNCSDSLLYAPQSVFYSQMIGVVKRIKAETSPDFYGDPLLIAEGFQDPEDIIQDILLGINAQTAVSGNQQSAQNQIKPQINLPGKIEESPGNTPSVSIQQDLQSDMGDESDNQGEKVISSYQRMQDPMDLDEMICRSICSNENVEVRKKMANQIILVGGTTKIKKFIDSLEEAVMDRFTSAFDDNIERVNVEQYNVQQHQQFLQQQLLLQSTGQAQLDANPEQLKSDPRFLSWIGASIIPKLESSRDMFISREKFVIDFKSYKEQFSEFKNAQISQTLEQMKNEQQQEEKKGEDVNMSEPNQKNPEESLSAQQLEQIEKEVARKLKKERTLEAGVKHIREKAPFHF